MKPLSKVYDSAGKIDRHVRINPRRPITLILLAAQVLPRLKLVAPARYYSWPSSVSLAPRDPMLTWM